jgi:HD-GYP domain-containing protein (c-di-GMP phosphodiesterase class II)
VLWLPQIGRVQHWDAVISLVILGVLADLFAVRVQRGMRVSTAHFAAPFAVIASSVTGGLIAAVGCLLGRLIFNRRDWNTFDIAVNIAAASVAGAVWEALSRFHANDGAVGYLLVVAVFALFRTMVNYGWTLEARSAGIAIPPVNAQIGKLMLACATLFTPSVALYINQRDNRVSALILLALPFLATQFLIRAFGRERDLNDSLEDANVSLTESLVNALDARDPYSGGHSVAVAVYSRDIAVEIGLDPHTVQRIYLAGLLHDVGKIAVPDAILRKPAALTDEEFDEIKKHPVVGEQILAPSAHFQDILPGVRHHHERIDGKGYPDNLRDEEIPLIARIIAVADAYNAMTSDRPYRDAMQPALAMRILIQNQGMQHDPFIVSAFHRVIDRKHHDYAIAAGPDFVTSERLNKLIGGHAVGNRDESAA